MRAAAPGTVTRRGLLAASALCLGTLALSGCSAAPNGGHGDVDPDRPSWSNPDLGCDLAPRERVELAFAQNFTLDRYDSGLSLACLPCGSRYLLVPEGSQAPEGLAGDICVLASPVSDIYLVSTSTYCLFDALDAVGSVSLVSTTAENCSVESFGAAIREGRVEYGGRYSSPDYELVVSRGAKLAVENLMINHTPEVREKLEALGVPVIMEQSSTEPDPLGRLEWIRLWGEFLGKADLARQVFDGQRALVEEVARDLAAQPLQKKVAFFYINANGGAVVRKPGDYVSKMIAMAGGTYAFASLETDDTASSSTTMEMERFYAEARDCDVVVYNSTIAGELSCLDDLLALNPLLADFKAVQEGRTWCTEQNVYQQMTSTGAIVRDLHEAIRGCSEDRLEFLFRLV